MPRRTKPLRRPHRLSPQRWADAALALLAQGGVGAVRVEPLARRLGVTKGSFYWHFRVRDDLLAAMLRRWEERATLDVAAEVEAAGGTAQARLRRLFALTATPGVVELELAIRAWARRDGRVRRAVAGVDERRLAYLRQLFDQLGAGDSALARGFLGYATLFGDYFIAMPTAGPERRALLEQCLDVVLATGGPARHEASGREARDRAR